jgi:hypothetical protein
MRAEAEVEGGDGSVLVQAGSYLLYVLVGLCLAGLVLILLAIFI